MATGTEVNMVDTEEYTITNEELVRLREEYRRQIDQSDGFDIEDIVVPPFCNPMSYHNYENGRFAPERILVKGYATVGLHRYNMLQSTSFELYALLKVNISPNCVASYYITLVAHDPHTQVKKTFQVRVDEEAYNTLNMTVSVARIKDEVPTTKTPVLPHFHFQEAAVAHDDRFRGELPDWPSDDGFNDTKRFYVVKESEWQAITPYLELAVVANNRNILFMTVKEQDSILTNLQILKVVIETTEDVAEKHKAKSAHIYITFKGLENDRRSSKAGEDVERKAIVRRVLDENTGYLSLFGKLWNGKTTNF